MTVSRFFWFLGGLKNQWFWRGFWIGFWIDFWMIFGSIFNRFLGRFWKGFGEVFGDNFNSFLYLIDKIQTYRKAVGMMKPSMILLGEVPDIIRTLSAIRLCKPGGWGWDIYREIEGGREGHYLTPPPPGPSSNFQDTSSGSPVNQWVRSVQGEKKG